MTFQLCLRRPTGNVLLCSPPKSSRTFGLRFRDVRAIARAASNFYDCLTLQECSPAALLQRTEVSRMFLAIAAFGCGLFLQPNGLMLHLQLATQARFSAEEAALIQPEDTGSPSGTEAAANFMPLSTPVSTTPGTQPPTTEVAEATEPVAVSSLAELPFTPVPSAAVNSSAPIAFLKSARPMTVSVAALREEDRRNRRLWMALGIASHGAAAFDAWSTRHSITTTGAQELNPLLRPFAGNASLYAVIQVAPALLDFAGRKMMYSRYSWVRRAWWVPQSASLVTSVFCGAHNLSVH